MICGLLKITVMVKSTYEIGWRSKTTGTVGDIGNIVLPATTIYDGWEKVELYIQIILGCHKITVSFRDWERSKVRMPGCEKTIFGGQI